MFALSGLENDNLESNYEKYSKKLFRLSFSILGSQVEAEDVMHDVFMKYLDKLPSFNDEKHEEAWFIRVTVNLCKDYLRKSKVRKYIQIEDLGDYGIEDKQAEDLSFVMKLPEKYKTIVILHYLEGYSTHEISKFLSISESGVKMRLSRGREMLKESIQEEGRDA